MGDDKSIDRMVDARGTDDRGVSPPQISNDDLIFSLARWRWEDPEAFLSSFVKIEDHIFPLLSGFGFQGSHVNDDDYLPDFDAAVKKWGKFSSADQTSAMASGGVADYMRTPKNLAKFRKREFNGEYAFDNGFFEVHYSPMFYSSSTGLFRATVPIHFVFEKSTWNGGVVVDGKWQTVSEVRYWEGGDEVKWRSEFIEIAQKTWSNQFTLYCHKAGWERLKAKVRINVEIVADNTPVRSGGKRWFELIAYAGDMPKGVPNVRPWRAEMSREHIKASAHEFGHMLGLGDEYEDTSKPQAKMATHSELVEKEFGYGVPRLGPDRQDRYSVSIMNGSGKVLPEHGVVFLEAIKKVTGVQEWHLKRKAP